MLKTCGLVYDLGSGSPQLATDAADILKKELKKSAKYVSNANEFIVHYYMHLFIVILCSEGFLFRPLTHEVICKLIMSLYSNSICKCQ